MNCLEPHPHIPVLATSGLDHSVKIFSPIAKEPSTLPDLDEVSGTYKKERERRGEGSAVFEGFSQLEC